MGQRAVASATGEQWLLIWWKHAVEEYGVYRDSYLDQQRTEKDLAWQPSTRVICKATGGLTTKNKLRTAAKYMVPFKYALAKELAEDLSDEEENEVQPDEDASTYIGKAGIRTLHRYIQHYLP